MGVDMLDPMGAGRGVVSKKMLSHDGSQGKGEGLKFTTGSDFTGMKNMLHSSSIEGGDFCSTNSLHVSRVVTPHV